MPTSKPNILIVMVDQLSALFLKAYGHPITKTPNLDRLASKGVVFENAYTPSPLCAPARAVFMSGQLPERTGVYDNAAEFPSAVPTFAHYLRLEGYRTCLSGKMHFVGPDQLHGFEKRLTTDIYPADFGWTPDWRLKQERIDWWYHNMTSVKQAGVAEMTNQLEYDDEVAFQANRMIFDYVRYEPGTPFCLCVSFTHPHDPYAARAQYWNLYKPEDIDMPKVAPIAYAELDPHSRRLWDVSAMDDYDVTEEDIRSSRHGYYANISYLDDKIGELVGTLKTCGIARNTLIAFTADHGDFLGERGLWYKMSFLEPSARVPFIIHAPGRYAPRRIKEPVSLADIVPTLIDVARPGRAGNLPCPIDGRSLLPLLEGKEESSDSGIYGVYLAEGVIAPMFMIRTGKWKYICCETDPEQLFDLEADPMEFTNLAQTKTKLTTSFRAEVHRRWDSAALTKRIMISQQSRHDLFAALKRGNIFPWDFQPLKKASEQYTRNHMDVTAHDRASRFPAAPEPKKKSER